MNEIIIAIIGSGLLSTIVSSIITSLNNKSKSDKALMTLIGFEVRKGCKAAIARGCMSLEELKQIEDMNNLYKEMGGNGYVSALMKKIELLEIKDDD